MGKAPVARGGGGTKSSRSWSKMLY